MEVPSRDSYVDSRPADSMLDEEAQGDFRAIVGKIGWISTTSRPDLSYDNLVLSTKLGNATVRDMRQAIKTMKKLKSDSTLMRFANLGNPQQWSLLAHGDAGYKSLPDKVSSSGGHVILLCNLEKNLACILNWRSKKLKRVVSSSTAAEVLAANEALDEMVYIKSVLGEILGEHVENLPMRLATDSNNLHKAVFSSTLVENGRMRTDVAKLQNSLKEKELDDFFLVPGKDMLADVLTKQGAPGFKLMNLLRTCELK